MSHEPTETRSAQGGHKGHLWMMAICCGLPIAGFFAIAVLGVTMPSLETALFLLCPIGMIGMMFFMHRDGCAGKAQGEKEGPAQSREKEDDGSPRSGAGPEQGNAVKEAG